MAAFRVFLLSWASYDAFASLLKLLTAAANQAAAAPCLQALFDLEATNNELKSDLRDLYITAAKEIDVAGSRKAIIVHVSSSQGAVAMAQANLVTGGAAVGG